MSKQLEADIQEAIGWLVNGAINITRVALEQDMYATRLLDRVRLITACAELPGDMPLRVRIMRDVFLWQA